ncbi:MAG TPA: ABC transporter permease [Actinomycetota bacterium]|nr:ABC transporter permease [Actinomycetota bacterium]
MAQSATDFKPTSEVGFDAGGEGSEISGVKARSPRQIFWERFKDDKLAIFGALLVLLMIAAALSAGFFENVTGHPFGKQFRGQDGEALMLSDFGTPLGPDKDFWFGADDLGRDLFVRVLYGARVSLRIAIIATGIEVLIGVVLGLLAGFRGRWVDTLVSRTIDLVLSVPFLLLGISLGIILDGGEMLVIVIIAFFGWPYIARVVRGQTLSLREAQFVEASYSVGASSRWIMFREILPNLLAPIIIYSTLIIPINIVGEASLSFLGVGVHEPQPAWGTMLSRASNYVSYGAAWWYMVFPGMFLFITVLGFNLLGDGLRDALDPKTARS